MMIKKAIKGFLIFTILALAGCNTGETEIPKFDINHYYLERLDNLEKVAEVKNFIEANESNDSSQILILQPSRCNMCTEGIVINLIDLISKSKIPTCILFVSDSDTAFNELFSNVSIPRFYIASNQAENLSLDFVENMQITFIKSEISSYRIVK